MVHRVAIVAAITVVLANASAAAAAACRDANGREVKCGVTTRTVTSRTTTISKTSHTRASGWILRLPGCGI